MQPGFISVPFKIPDAHSGFSKIDGLAKFSAAGIVLEFEAKLLGLMKTGVKEVRIPLSEILDLKVKSGAFDTKLEKLFGAKIEIRINSFTTLREIPNKDGRIILKILRSDRDLAEKAVRVIEEYKTKPMLPRGESPVSLIYEDETEELSS
jgi:hypothetical protein